MTVFHTARRVPTNSCILLSSPEEARAYPTGDIQLAFCADCGFISNVAFDPGLTEYSARYEETQGYSPTFNAFHRALAERLIERYDLHDKDVIEIGCGKGEFLMLLCELGGNRGIGFDPGVHVARIQGPAADRVQFIADFYSDKYADHRGDFVACKMTLEHIHPTGDFIGTLRRAIGDRVGTDVFFQIPESTRIVRDCAFEDIYYEHCSYFSPGSLARLFRRSGFEVVSLDTEYASQYLTIEARAAEMPVRQPPLPAEDDIAVLAGYTQTFPDRLPRSSTTGGCCLAASPMKENGLLCGGQAPRQSPSSRPWARQRVSWSAGLISTPTARVTTCLALGFRSSARGSLRPTGRTRW